MFSGDAIEDPYKVTRTLYIDTPKIKSDIACPPSPFIPNSLRRFIIETTLPLANLIKTWAFYTISHIYYRCSNITESLQGEEDLLLVITQRLGFVANYIKGRFWYFRGEGGLKQRNNFNIRNIISTDDDMGRSPPKSTNRYLCETASIVVGIYVFRGCYRKNKTYTTRNILSADKGLDGLPLSEYNDIILWPIPSEIGYEF